MLTGLIVLLLCQLAGEVVVRTLGLSLPGPILGMVLLLVVLQVLRPHSKAGIVRAPSMLLRYLPLLYVPAGVGVIGYLSLLASSALPITVGIVAGWLAALLVTAGATALVLWLTGARKVLR